MAGSAADSEQCKPPSNGGSVHTCQGGQSRLRILSSDDQEERGYPHSKSLEKAHLPSLPAVSSGCVSSSQSPASLSLWGPGVPVSDPPLLSSPDPEELLLGSSATPSSSSLLPPSLEELSYLRTGWEAPWAHSSVLKSEWHFKDEETENYQSHFMSREAQLGLIAYVPVAAMERKERKRSLSVEDPNELQTLGSLTGLCTWNTIFLLHDGFEDAWQGIT